MPHIIILKTFLVKKLIRIFPIRNVRLLLRYVFHINNKKYSKWKFEIKLNYVFIHF